MTKCFPPGQQEQPSDFSPSRLPYVTNLITIVTGAAHTQGDARQWVGTWGTTQLG